MLKLLIATVLIALTFAAKDSFKDYSLRKVGKVKLRIDKQRLNRYNEFKLWSDFKRKHGKTYTDDMEDSNRFAIFHQNHRMVNQHNQGFRDGLHTFEMEINQFGDMTNEEFTSTMNGFKRSYGDSLAKGHGSTFLEPFNVTYPHKMDWRTHGYVTPVKNQGQCGSCWSFSATGSLEGQHMRKTGRQVSLSEQNLVDCSRQYGNNGCEGGLMDQAFQYIKANGGIDTEGSYPYVAKDDTCEFQESEVGAEDTGFMDIIPHGHENALKAAVATIGPVSVAIDASHPSFQFYKKGVYIEPQCSPGQLDHGVLVIGYGTTTDQQDYWIVKNSWGPTWGEQGYIRMARNRNNQCGVATQASYPLV